ncbi:putative endothelial lipase isoform X2 [Pristis pectinata]|uniref:putative endothelial lipase isoform X2 n=1 Tax=Pristis pectinata TaxID=685728 RepID=UPI00223D04DD|nr:putative endothelial lipase isoform X2 [Pristis pectinata]
MSSFTLCVSLLSLLSTGFSEKASKDTLTGKAVQDVLHKENLDQHYRTIQTKFNLQSSTSTDEKDCAIIAGVSESLGKCNFNRTSKTFIIIHGWTTTGLMESWINGMVKALQKQEAHANVIVVNWLERAHQLYTVAVNNSEVVGKEVAILIDWLKQVTNLPLQKLHLIGYSLGAHVAGFAGKAAQKKIGRITGLDPAGPMFEGENPDKRLSPDDADFVDVLHTFAYSRLGVSIGIAQPIGHIDVYPNGGSFQPGCGLHDVFNAITNGNLGDVIYCEHERSVHLFVDSILNQDKQSLMYRCPDTTTFEKGMCLSCRSNRCNKLGYNVKEIRSKRSNKMYLKTRADMPFKVFHYQLKMHLFSAEEIQGTNPKLNVNLYGTEIDSKKTSIEMPEQVIANRTNSFLVCLEEDIGDLLKIKLSWEKPTSSWSFWTNFKSFWYGSDSAEKEDLNELEIRKIRVKSGEMQKNLFKFITRSV